MSENRYCIEYAKRGTAGCKKCKQKIEKDSLRIGKIVPNPFTESGGDMKQWFHVDCIFQQLSRARATTKKIDDPGDLEGWADVEDSDRKVILRHIEELATGNKPPKTSKTPSKPGVQKPRPDSARAEEPQPTNSQSEYAPALKPSKDDAFKDFRRLCARISEESTYTGKTAIVSDFFKRDFSGDLLLWVKFLLPMVNKRIYNLQSKQLVKVFARVFAQGCYEEMVEDLEQGDVAETVRIFFEKYGSPAKKSTLSLQEVDNYLERLSKLTREEDQEDLFSKLAARCTGNDLKMVVRLIKHDIRINSGPKHILVGLHPDAYAAFQVSRDLSEVVRLSRTGDMKVKATLLTPMIPMLAEACGSAEDALAKSPHGLYAEIKYDGERVQLHKRGTEFLFFSRSLKPVATHKVSHLVEFIPKAFPHGKDLVLDSEILLVDKATGKPLPFGTLGKHKRTAFNDASVCLFVFDCLHYNGESLLHKPLRDRRAVLLDNMTPVQHHVEIGEHYEVKTVDRLRELIADVLSQGLEGLVLKDPSGIYEPGKRHWLKVKKDYLKGGSMADTADLVVLGAYFGTGNNGGIMSTFLMGCWDPAQGCWCTVTKVHGGHDDATLKRLQSELRMCKISRQADRVPRWLNVQKPLVPDFVAEDPDEAQVWEIAGAEFTRAEIHTADGISIRFPRVVHIRTDKTAKEATTLPELRKLFKVSRSQGTITAEALGGKAAKLSSERKEEDEDSLEDTKCAAQEAKGPRTPLKRKQCETPQTSGKKQKKQCNFPNVFSGVRMCLPENRLLRRYFVAYDGELVRDKDATHVIFGMGTKCKGVKVVKQEWLWDSIKRQERQPEKNYV
uniref:DNA ligase n=1 Tax=Ornithodoros turicata TaxID=34597 RepID=A0A2R5LJI1_9ACAR